MSGAWLADRDHRTIHGPGDVGSIARRWTSAPPGSRPTCRRLCCNDRTWQRLVDAHAVGEHLESFASAFDNGAAFLHAADGLRSRRPRVVEWKGPHRPPGDDVIPADIRVGHVYQVSCKYLSKIPSTPGRLDCSNGSWSATNGQVGSGSPSSLPTNTRSTTTPFAITLAMICPTTSRRSQTGTGPF